MNDHRLLFLWLDGRVLTGRAIIVDPAAFILTPWLTTASRTLTFALAWCTCGTACWRGAGTWPSRCAWLSTRLRRSARTTSTALLVLIRADVVNLVAEVIQFVIEKHFRVAIVWQSWWAARWSSRCTLR